MPKKLLILAATIIGAQVAQALILGASPAGTLVANLLEISASVLATIVCLRAARRANGLARPFWTLLACGMAVWAVANSGWMYYELVLHQQPPPGSPIRFLFNTQAIFFAIVLFLDQEKDSSEFKPEFLLDFTQIAIVFFFVYLGLYYLPSSGLQPQSGAARRLWVEFGEIGIILVLAGFQTVRARAVHIRKLYGGFALYLLVFLMGMVVAEYRESAGTPTGTLSALCWTIPFLWAALWAAHWAPSPSSRTAPRARQKTLTGLILNNAMFALAPLIVLVQVAQFPSEWKVLRFSLLAVSILCFAMRLGMSAFREAETAELVRRQTMAMDSAAEGISIVDETGKHIYVNAAFARMMGHDSPDSMLGVHWMKIYDPRDIQRLQAEVRQALAAEGKWSGQVTLRRRDGATVPIEMALTTLANGVTACIGHDISARKEAEKARADAENKYRTLVEQVAAISYIAELGFHGDWLYVSPQIESITGYSPEEWLANASFRRKITRSFGQPKQLANAGNGFRRTTASCARTARLSGSATPLLSLREATAIP
jgi:PAS domain S-box-containing protein